jgi:hypothetical protein
MKPLRHPVLTRDVGCRALKMHLGAAGNLTCMFKKWRNPALASAVVCFQDNARKKAPLEPIAKSRIFPHFTGSLLSYRLEFESHLAEYRVAMIAIVGIVVFILVV